MALVLALLLIQHPLYHFTVTPAHVFSHFSIKNTMPYSTTRMPSTTSPSPLLHRKRTHTTATLATNDTADNASTKRTMRTKPRPTASARKTANKPPHFTMVPSVPTATLEVAASLTSDDDEPAMKRRKIPTRHITPKVEPHVTSLTHLHSGSGEDTVAASNNVATAPSMAVNVNASTAPQVANHAARTKEKPKKHVLGESFTFQLLYYPLTVLSSVQSILLRPGVPNTPLITQTHG